ncbi:MAG: small-conductance mechanosensitive channel [Planctomycetota bacterium]
MEEAKSRLESAGIVIPFPQRDLHIITNEKN